MKYKAAKAVDFWLASDNTYLNQSDIILTSHRMCPYEE